MKSSKSVCLTFYIMASGWPAFTFQKRVTLFKIKVVLDSVLFVEGFIVSCCCSRP